MEVMPGQDIVYYGDTARMPYGDKPPEEIVRYARQIISFLVERGVSAVAVACNTSSAIAVPVIGRDFDVPVVGMIQCGAAAAAEASRSGRIGVIATANTVRSGGAYSRAIANLRPAPVFRAGVSDARAHGRAVEKFQVPVLERLLQDT